MTTASAAGSQLPVAGHHVVIVGAGGNIGSQLVPLMARWPRLGRLTLIDRDVYEARNLAGQNISAADVGCGKAACQTRAARRIRPRLDVRALHADVAQLPLGRLRGDVILACLDSRRARQHVNEAARRLGVPWIDSGVEAQSLLARVKVYGASAQHACLECAWDGRDYELLEVSYACQSDPGRDEPPTDAPACLGALTAALQAIECQKLLVGGGDLASTDRQVLLDALHLRHYVTRFGRNANCRLGDHTPWRIERVQGLRLRSPLSAVAQHALGDDSDARRWSLGCHGQRLVRLLTCPACGKERKALVSDRALRERERRCRGCGASLVAAALQAVDRVPLADLGPQALRRTLAQIGFRAGDVLTLSTADAEVHLEIDDD